MMRRTFLTSSLAASALAATAAGSYLQGAQGPVDEKGREFYHTPALSAVEWATEETLRRFFPGCVGAGSEPLENRSRRNI